jgi:phospholipid/cholesterol/gamma-HCH transport system substrate-binding protein
VGDDPITVHIMFRDVLDLVPLSTVKVNDVNVGKVSDVSLDGFTADVTSSSATTPSCPTTRWHDPADQPAGREVRLPVAARGRCQQRAAPERRRDPARAQRPQPRGRGVLGALSLLLNGGGVAQLRTIARELNVALEGREGTTRSVLDQIRTLMTQLDDHKADIVNAIDKLNDRSRLGQQAARHRSTPPSTSCPPALVSIDKQRDDLVKMLDALAS